MGGALILVGAVALIVFVLWYSSTPQAKAAQAAQAEKAAAQRGKIVCQFCHEPGHVTVRQVRRVKRKTATRIMGAAVTMGGSLPVAGVSKKGTVTELSCSNCGMTWDAPQVKP